MTFCTLLQVHVNVSPDNPDEPDPTEFQTVSLNIHPSNIPTQPNINSQVPPVLADEHLNFAGNLENQHKVPTSGDSRPQETPLAEPSPPQQHQQRDQQYLNDGRQNGESQEQDEEPFGKQVHRVKDVYMDEDELDEDESELDKDESYAEITPKTPSEQTRERYESQEPLPSKLDEPNAPDSVPSTLNTPQPFSSETERPEPVIDSAHKPEPFKESPHVVEPTPATFELRHTQEPTFEEPPLTLDPLTSEPAPTPEPGHSTFDPSILEPAPTPEPGHSTFDTTATTSDSPVETQESDKESEHDQWQAEDSRSVNDDDDDDDGDYEDEEDDGGYEDEDEDDDDDDKDPYDDGGLKLEPGEEGGPEIVLPNQNERGFTRRFEELQQLHREQKEIMKQQELLHQQQGETSEQQEDESSEQKQQQKQFDQQHQEREDDQQQQQEQYNHQRQEEHVISQQHSQDEEPNQQQNTPDGSETPPTTREDPPIPQGGPIPPINKREADTNTQFEHQTPTTIAPPSNCPEMTTHPCECPDIGPPPPCPKLGVDEYVPLPGSESGVMSLVEQYRVYVREMVLATFPQSVAEWIVENVSCLHSLCVN